MRDLKTRQARNGSLKLRRTKHARYIRRLRRQQARRRHMLGEYVPEIGPKPAPVDYEELWPEEPPRRGLAPMLLPMALPAALGALLGSLLALAIWGGLPLFQTRRGAVAVRLK